MLTLELLRAFDYRSTDDESHHILMEGPAREFLFEDEFERFFRASVQAYCTAQNEPVPTEAWFGRVFERLPLGLRQSVAIGLQEGSIVPLQGYQFTLVGLPAGRVFRWLGRARSGPPYVNWEWFVHAAEYARTRSLATAQGLQVRFEHENMDIALFVGGRLLTCIEVKVRVSTVDSLVKAIHEYGKRGVDLAAPDRHKDHLRKAKYLVRKQPTFFSAVAIGKRYEFNVQYVTRGNLLGFRLQEDVIPFG